MSPRRGGVLLRPITGFYFAQSESNLYWMQWAEQSPAPTENDVLWAEQSPAPTENDVLWAEQSPAPTE